MNNKQLIAEFNAADVKSVCARSYPWIGGNRAEFYRNAADSNGWLIATDSTGPASNKHFAFKIPAALVDAVDSIEYDPYNDAAYASALLKLSDTFRAE